MSSSTTSPLSESQVNEPLPASASPSDHVSSTTEPLPYDNSHHNGVDSRPFAADFHHPTTIRRPTTLNLLPISADDSSSATITGSSASTVLSCNGDPVGIRKRPQSLLPPPRNPPTIDVQHIDEQDRYLSGADDAGTQPVAGVTKYSFVNSPDSGLASPSPNCDSPNRLPEPTAVTLTSTVIELFPATQSQTNSPTRAPSTPGYRIAQTPTNSTIVIISRSNSDEINPISANYVRSWDESQTLPVNELVKTLPYDPRSRSKPLSTSTDDAALSSTIEPAMTFAGRQSSSPSNLAAVSITPAPAVDRVKLPSASTPAVSGQMSSSATSLNAVKTATSNVPVDATTKPPASQLANSPHLTNVNNKNVHRSSDNILVDATTPLPAAASNVKTKTTNQKSPNADTPSALAISKLLGPSVFGLPSDKLKALKQRQEAQNQQKRNAPLHWPPSTDVCGMSAGNAAVIEEPTRSVASLRLVYA